MILIALVGLQWTVIASAHHLLVCLTKILSQGLNKNRQEEEKKLWRYWKEGTENYWQNKKGKENSISLKRIARVTSQQCTRKRKANRVNSTSLSLIQTLRRACERREEKSYSQPKQSHSNRQWKKNTIFSLINKRYKGRSFTVRTDGLKIVLCLKLCL